MTRPIHVGFLTRGNPYDRRSFSGTLYHMLQALEATPGLKIKVLGPHRPLLPRFFQNIRDNVSKKPSFSDAVIDFTDIDILLNVVSSGLINQFISSIKCPIIFVTDATPFFLRDFYNIEITATQIESDRQAIAGSTMVVYSSYFMMKRALAEFDTINESKVSYIPFGINLKTMPDTVPVKPELDRLELLFIGKDWRRKGGGVAVDAVDHLLAEGRDVRLTVIGPQQKDVPDHRAVECLGFLDKNDPRDEARLSGALDRAHVFVLPTKGDCTPMVVAEANAHGCPVLITETGGIPSLMSPGRNGYMLPPDADGRAYAAAIRQITADATSYRRLCETSFEHCHTRLTWKAWATDMKALVEQAIRR